jgi:amino acid transporter
MNRVLQIICIVLTALILFALREAFMSLRGWFGPDFPFGFISGFLFAAALYGVICWIDPSSRPRGSSSEK